MNAITKKRLTDLKFAVRNPYAWPGGYPIVSYMSDCQPICSACLKKDYRQILRSTHDNDRSPWEFAFADIYWEGPALNCCNCGKLIESAYGDPESDELESNVTKKEITITIGAKQHNGN